MDFNKYESIPGVMFGKEIPLGNLDILDNGDLYIQSEIQPNSIDSLIIWLVEVTVVLKELGYEIIYSAYEKNFMVAGITFR